MQFQLPEVAVLASQVEFISSVGFPHPVSQPLHFLCDPPVLVDDWHLSPVGVQLIERNGITHIIDWVGSMYYPNVADFALRSTPTWFIAATIKQT